MDKYLELQEFSCDEISYECGGSGGSGSGSSRSGGRTGRTLNARRPASRRNRR